MKKIYTSMIALACGALISASARDVAPAPQLSLDAVSANVKANLTINSSVAANKAQSRSGENWTLIGTGYFTDGIFSDLDVQVDIYEDADTPGYFAIDGAWAGTELPETAPLIIDATNPNNVKIPFQGTGVYMSNNIGEASILSYSYYGEANGLTDEDFIENFPEYVITFVDGVITMPGRSILENFAESKNPNVSPDDLYYANTDNMYVYMPGVEYTPEWGETLPSQMVECFLSPLFLRDLNVNPIDITVQKNNLVEGVYRISGAWQNLGTDGGKITIDARVPECVIFPLQPTDLEATGLGQLYVGNECGIWYDSIDEYLQDMAAADPEEYSVWTMDENGLISIPAPYGNFFVFPDTYDEKTGKMEIYYAELAQPSWIQIPQFSGISSVAVDNTNAPVEYYNIQGVRVANPTAGNIYIVKQGTKVSKTVIR